jgi:hypothetical protein
MKNVALDIKLNSARKLSPMHISQSQSMPMLQATLLSRISREHMVQYLHVIWDMRMVVLDQVMAQTRTNNP